MKKETKKKLIAGFIILSIIGYFVPDTKQKDESDKTTKKEQTQDIDINNMTLGMYKNQNEKIKIMLTDLFITKNKWNGKLKDEYERCMDDFTKTKDNTLLYSEVIKWCNINLEPPKEKSLKTIKKLNNVADVMENFGGPYNIRALSNNSIILYTKYFPTDSDYTIIEEAKRTFIDAVFQTFLYTDFKTVTIAIIPQNFKDTSKSKFSFKASIKKEDAIKVMRKALNVHNIMELYQSSGATNRKFNQARYNDQGGITLDVFFKELSKVTY